MPDPLVVQAIRGFKQSLLAREHLQMVSMAQRWLQVEQALDAQIAALAREFDERRRNGETITQGALFRLERFQSLQRQLLVELDRYEEYADGTISNGQRDYARIAIDHASQSISLQFEGVGTFFDRLPIEAVENMVGLAGDGSPLATLLREGWGDSATGLINELITSTALGRNPNETARRMKKGMSQGLNRALNIARTEQLRVYRHTSQQQYQTSGVVTGHRRLVAHDDRVCAACLMKEGELLEVGEPVYDHPSGRCSSVPNVDGLRPVQYELGRDWILRQDEATQRAILGKGRYDAWRAGQFDLDQLATVTRDRTWGPGLQVTPLNQLTAN